MNKHDVSQELGNITQCTTVDYSAWLVSTAVIAIIWYNAIHLRRCFVSICVYVCMYASTYVDIISKSHTQQYLIITTTT